MRSKWKNPTVHLGDVKASSSRTIYFYAIDTPEIKSMKASCGCTEPVYEDKRGRIKVTYKASKLPPQLEFQPLKTNIRLVYQDETMEYLYITLTKIRG